MAGVYKTFIANLLGALPQKLAWQVQSHLADLFSPCISNDFENNWVYFADAQNKPDKHELLVYFMPAQTSIIKHVPSVAAPDLSIDGNTAYAAGASEVYVKSSDPLLLANLAFHELMHNRLKVGNSLHRQGGLASAVVYNSTEITKDNIRAMAKVISKPIKQWTDGIALLADGKNDPISEYYKAY
jgi:hypothetical protein